MRIVITSVLVDDQEKALRFYTDVLGFVKKTDVPAGEDRWLTVVSPEDPDGPELLLEPDRHPAARPFKNALVADGIAFTSFGVADVNNAEGPRDRGYWCYGKRPTTYGSGRGWVVQGAEAARLRGLGVRFTQEPFDVGDVTIAVFDDTCGNLIQIVSTPKT